MWHSESSSRWSLEPASCALSSSDGAAVINRVTSGGVQMATKRGRLVSLSVMFALGSMLAVDVMAQQAQVVGTPGTLEEVVVTARKRAHAFRDVPATISVSTERAIEAAGIPKPAAYVHTVPNMKLVET